MSDYPQWFQWLPSLAQCLERIDKVPACLAVVIDDDGELVHGVYLSHLESEVAASRPIVVTNGAGGSYNTMGWRLDLDDEPTRLWLAAQCHPRRAKGARNVAIEAALDWYEMEGAG